MVTPIECQYCTYRHLNIGHGMVQTGTNNTHQLAAGIDDFRPQPLIVTLVPLLCASLHLCHIVGSQGQVLQMMMSSDSPGLDEVLERKTVEGLLGTSQTLGSLIYILGVRILLGF